MPSSPTTIFSIANYNDRQSIYSIRHKVYAEELQQHAVNNQEQLTDELDDFNVYIVAKIENDVIGFISITPSRSPRFSIDKYVAREAIPLEFDDHLFEIRLLTVDKIKRSSSLALLLMYAAMRYIEMQGGKYIVAICKSDIIEMYRKAGLKFLECTIKSGQVQYQLAIASIDDLKLVEEEKKKTFTQLKERITWNLPYPYSSTPCFHGGAFFKAIGEDLQSLHKKNDIINADVLDAWFPPSPKVTEALTEHLAWLLQTSPPTHASGLIDAIASARKIDKRYILPGAGSSDLIFLGLQHFLSAASSVLIIDPCYGEYIHVLENVVGCKVTRFNLSRAEGFVVDTSKLLNEMKKGYDMVVLVNPNSPTGVYVDKGEMKYLVEACPDVLIWLDETYIDYVGSSHSLEALVPQHQNLIICKSMSKAYALSGVRVAYLCACTKHIESLKSFTPPWAVSLPAQLAAITALKDEKYYHTKYKETEALREILVDQLHALGINETIKGVANFILFFLPTSVTTDKFIEECSNHNLFLRNVKNMGLTLGKGAVRIAVKDRVTNFKMIEIIGQVLSKITRRRGVAVVDY